MNQEITVLQLSPNKPLIVNLNTDLEFPNAPLELSRDSHSVCQLAEIST